MTDLSPDLNGPQDSEAAATGHRIALFGTGASLRLFEKLPGVIEAEPAPATTSEALCQRFGFLGFSARTGAVGSLKALQLIFDAAVSGTKIAAWQRLDGRFVDPFRPEIEPEGLADAAQVLALRQSHHLAMQRVLGSMDELILIVDSTEHARDTVTGLDYPFVPGADFADTLRQQILPHVPELDELDSDFTRMMQQLTRLRPDLRVKLALAPQRPGATISRAAQRQLADLRCMMGEWACRFENVSYLPLWDVSLASEDVSAAESWAMARSLLGAANLAVDQPASEPSPPEPTAPEETEEERRARKAAKRERKRKRAGAGSGTVCEDELLEAFSR